MRFNFFTASKISVGILWLKKWVPEVVKMTVALGLLSRRTKRRRDVVRQQATSCVFIDRTRVMRPKEGSAEGAEKIIVSRTEPKDHKSSNGVLLLRNMVMSLTVSESLYQRFRYGKTRIFLVLCVSKQSQSRQSVICTSHFYRRHWYDRIVQREKIFLNLSLRPRFVRTWDWRKK